MARGRLPGAGVLADGDGERGLAKGKTGYKYGYKFWQWPAKPCKH